MTQLSFGGGEFDVLLDFAAEETVVYNGGDEFHSRYGGEQYYGSWSGLSGAGWIPSRLDRVVVRGYRTETESPWARFEPIGAGVQVGIPTYREGGGRIPAEWPVLIHRPHKRLVVCHPDYAFQAIAAGLGSGEEQEYTFEFYPAPGEEHRTFSAHYEYWGYPKWLKQNRGNVHAVLRALNRKCFFQWGGTVTSLPFWSRLGLHWQADGCAYKVAKGVAWKRYTQADLQTQEQRQDAAPANVLFITERHYLQRSRDGDYEAVGLSGDGLRDYEIGLTAALAMRALMGEHAAIIAELDAGIATKVAVDEAAKAGIDALDAAIDANSGRVLTIDDGMAAGACRVGIERFRDEHFPGRDAVTVQELARFIADRDVERVLRHALFGTAS